MRRSSNRLGLALVAVTLLGLAATALLRAEPTENEGPRPARSRRGVVGQMERYRNN